jgi:HK97 family phage major capsid protein
MADAVMAKVEELANQIHQAFEADKKGNKEEFAKLADASANTLTEINELKSAMAKRDEVIKDLELKASRAPAGVKVKRVAPEEYRDMMDSYLRSKGKKSYTFNYEIAQKSLDWAVENSKAMTMVMTKAGKIEFKKDVIAGINPQGGYWTLPEYSARDVEKFYQTNPLRQMANVMTTGTNELRMIIDDQLSESGGWVGETESRSTTDTARIGELSIPIHEQFAEPKASHWMLDDVNFDLVSWITGKTEQIFNLFENSAFLVGDGSKKPKGILAYDKWGGAAVAFGDDSNYERNALEYILSGANGAVTYNGFVNLQLSLLEQYQAGAEFLMTRKTWAETLQLKDTQDRPLYQLANLLATGANQVLLGKNVRIAAANQTINQGGTDVTLGGMPEVGTTGAAAVIYGDFNQGYGIVDRIGFTTITDIYTEKQYVKYYTRKRLGGALTSYQSLKVLELSAGA